jgi:altronate dehydratase
MNGDIDIDAGTILEKKHTIQEVGCQIFQETLDVASGHKLTRAEEAGYHTEFKIWESLWPAQCYEQGSTNGQSLHTAPHR